MAKPIIIVVDGDEAGRGALEGVLTNRFGTDYEIVPESSTDGCLATLAWLRLRAGTVALIIAAQRTDSADPEFFSRAHALFPGAKRLLIMPMALASPESVLPLLTLGQIDEYFVTPWGHPEEKLYPQITELLSAWVQTVDRPTVEVVKVVGRQWAPRSHELRDLLERNHVPFGFYTEDSRQGRQLREAGQDGSRLPVVVLWDGRAWSTRDGRARAGGGQPDQGGPMGCTTSSIVGAGPAGLAAAVYAASEGLRVCDLGRRRRAARPGPAR